MTASNLRISTTFPWVYPALFLAVCFHLLMGLQGCSKPATLDTLITEKTDIGFEQWLYRIRNDLPPETFKEIRDARQEIRYQVMSEETGLSFEESQKRVYERITGKSIRALLLKGYQLKTARTVDLIQRARDYVLIVSNRLAVESDPDHREKLNHHISVTEERIHDHRQDLKIYETRQAELKRGRNKNSD